MLFRSSISQATTSTNGYLSSTDWNTFNGKQPQLNGTGFVKASGTTISYDNNTYLTAAITSLGGLTGATQTFANDTNVTISSSSTTHTLGWSGQLSVSRGGTGLSTTPSNGQLLIGNTTGNTLTKATLTAGTGISITNGAGSITIATSGSSSSTGANMYLAANFGAF